MQNVCSNLEQNHPNHCTTKSMLETTEEIFGLTKIFCVYTEMECRSKCGILIENYIEWFLILI